MIILFTSWLLIYENSFGICSRSSIFEVVMSDGAFVLSLDAWELSRHTAHAALRDAVLVGDVQLLKTLIAELAGEAEPIINMAPNGSNTLLFM